MCAYAKEGEGGNPVVSPSPSTFEKEEERRFRLSQKRCRHPSLRNNSRPWASGRNSADQKMECILIAGGFVLSLVVDPTLNLQVLFTWGAKTPDSGFRTPHWEPAPNIQSICAM